MKNEVHFGGGGGGVSPESTSYLQGVAEISTLVDMREGGVQNRQKIVDVFNGRPQIVF